MLFLYLFQLQLSCMWPEVRRDFHPSVTRVTYRFNNLPVLEFLIVYDN